MFGDLETKLLVTAEMAVLTVKR